MVTWITISDAKNLFSNPFKGTLEITQRLWVLTNLDSILKSRDITLPTKVHLVKAMVFPVVMYGCESWTIKNAECWRIDAFELWYWRRLLSPLDSKDQTSQPWRKSVLNIHWKDWCWSWNPNNLATWCEKLTHLKRPWCWERLRAGGEGDDRGWDDWMALRTQWTCVWVNSRSWWGTGRPGMLWSMGSQRVGHDWAIELNWTGLWRQRLEQLEGGVLPINWRALLLLTFCIHILRYTYFQFFSKSFKRLA